MSPDEIARLASALKLSPQQLEYLKNLSQSQGGSTNTPVDIDIRLVSGKSLAAKKGSDYSSGLGVLAQRLPPEIRKKLIEIEPKVLHWISLSEKNAYDFAHDPIAALRRAVPNLDEKFYASIAALRQTISSAEPRIPGIEINRIRVSAEAKR